jgi:hypothetical protein
MIRILNDDEILRVGDRAIRKAPLSSITVNASSAGLSVMVSKGLDCGTIDHFERDIPTCPHCGKAIEEEDGE